MHDEDMLPALLTVSTAAFLCFLVMQISSCEIKTRSMISDSISRGNDPIESSCAINGNVSSPVCVARVAQKSIKSVDKSSPTTVSGVTFSGTGSAPGFLFQSGDK